jgi:hypothetical protein
MMMRPVLIEWKDIVYDAGWHTQKQFDDWVTNGKHQVVKQLGFLLEDEDNQLVIVDSYFEDRSAYGTIHKIPKGCVVSMTDLRIQLPLLSEGS